MNASVLEAIKKSAAVPSMPQVVSRFLEIMRDPDFDYANLVKVLSSDAGTASEILRLANSSLFGLRHKVVSLRHALTLLGPKRTRSLLLGRYLVDVLASKRVAALDMSYFWRRSLASSLIASRFAESVIPQQRDEALMGALLADIGIPVLAEAMPDSYGPIAARYRPHEDPITAKEEQEAVEATHGEVSAMILAHWSLPETVTRAVSLHQSDNPGQGEAASVARVLNAAERIARLLCEVPEADEIAAICSSALSIVGVDLEVLVSLLPTIESDIEELASTLRIDVIPSSVYAVIARAVQESLGVSTV